MCRHILILVQNCVLEEIIFFTQIDQASRLRTEVNIELPDQYTILGALTNCPTLYVIDCMASE